jgi:hypothetical protein
VTTFANRQSRKRKANEERVRRPASNRWADKWSMAPEPFSRRIRGQRLHRKDGSALTTVPHATRVAQRRKVSR